MTVPMLSPDEMAQRYGLPGMFHSRATAAQRRRMRRKARRIYGMFQAEREAWIAAVFEKRGHRIR